jgi:hypothetical protein
MNVRSRTLWADSSPRGNAVVKGGVTCALDTGSVIGETNRIQRDRELRIRRRSSAASSLEMGIQQ